MDFQIKKAAVLGAGVMGAGIACHLAGCGIEVLLLDLLPRSISESDRAQGITEGSPAWRNRLASSAIERMMESGRAGPVDLGKVTVGNLEDDFEKIGQCDWILETIIEDLEVKKALYQKLEAYRRKGSIVSTNTSGIPIAQISQGFSSELAENFLGTHFFNPPTYIKLIELVPGPATRPEVLGFMKGFFAATLRKGPIVVKDTPNFIANRLIAHSYLNVFHRCEKEGYTVMEVDSICGRVMGRTQTGVFKSIDAIGLDTVGNVTRNLERNLLDDEKRELFRLPEFARRMIEKGWLGDKSGQGFYLRPGSGEEKVIDLATLEYREKKDPSFPCLKDVGGIKDEADRVKALFVSADRGARLAWTVMSDDLVYAADRIGEIADTILEIDLVMKWGYYWRLGPFELWDALGLERVADRLVKDGWGVPARVVQLLDSGYTSFYREIGGSRYFYDFLSQGYQLIS
ncbi:MAG: 3-hydroxyacyl-CoA dehydrogenase family protein [Firmicutes bacterium]|nr:3-hydroxyacyl-CoA dehydrogenase family protein [Bacillota bacterium]